MFDHLREESSTPTTAEGLAEKTRLAIALTAASLGSMAAVAGLPVVEHPPTDPNLGWLGLAIGLYFIVCSTIYREFFLYRLKIERAVRFYGEGAEDVGHVIYGAMGVLLVIVGIMKLAMRM